MAQPLYYLTTNPGKIAEAERFLRGKHGLDLTIMHPGFAIPEIQASTCAEVAAFSAEFAASTVGQPCLKSDTGLYVDCLGNLPGPYNAYFDKQLGTARFLELLQYDTQRSARLEHCFAFAIPGQEARVFSGGSTGRISHKAQGRLGRWHDLFFIPDGETLTLSELRAVDPEREATYYGTALDDFANWYKANIG